MADLQTRQFQKEDTPVYKQVAVQREYREADNFTGQAQFADAEVYKAGIGFTKFLAGVVGQVEAERDEASADKMIEKIRSKSLNNYLLIDVELPKMESSDLTPIGMMEEYVSGKLQTESGDFISLEGVETYEGYEDLSTKEKRRVSDEWNAANNNTKQSLIKQIATLSRDHKLLKLTKNASDTHNTVIGVLNNKESYLEDKDVAPYVKDFIAKNKDTDLGYVSYWLDQLKQGNSDFPGSGGKSTPKDLGVKGGLTPEASRQVDQELSKHFSVLFESLKKRTVEFSDVKKNINELMQATLLDIFEGEYAAFPQQAIEKAKSGEYKYTYGFDGEGQMPDEVEYILDPTRLKPYIRRHNTNDVPKTDHVYVSTEIENLKSKAEKGEDINLDSYKATLARNEKYTDHDRGRLYEIAASLNRNKRNLDITNDKTAIITEIDASISKNTENIMNFTKVDENGNLLPDLEKARKNIDDLETTTYEWQHKDLTLPIGDQREGKLVKNVTITKGINRKGASKITYSDIMNFISQHGKNTRLYTRNSFEKGEENNLISPQGRRQIVSDWAVDGQPEVPDASKIEKAFEDKMIKLGYSDPKQLLTFVTVLLGRAKTKSDAYIAGIDKVSEKFKKGYPKNILALEEAIRKQHKRDIDHYKNIVYGGEPIQPSPDGKQRSGMEVHKGVDHIRILLNDMRTKNNNPDMVWGVDEQGMIDDYRDAFGNLLRIATQHRLWTGAELKGELENLSQKGPDSHDYYMNHAFAKHIKARIKYRLAALADPHISYKMIFKELREEDFWQKKFPNVPTDGGLGLLVVKINKHLGISNLHHAKKIENFSGVEKYKKGKSRIEEVKEAASIERLEHELNTQLGQSPVDFQ